MRLPAFLFQKSGFATFLRNAEECFPTKKAIFLRKTTRPTGSPFGAFNRANAPGRYDYSPADGFTHAPDMLFLAAKDGK